MISALSVLLAALAAQAVPMGTSNNGRDYYLNVTQFERWSGGLYGRMRDRDMKVGGYERSWETASILAYLGYDVLPWMTVYGMAGPSSAKIEGSESDDSTEVGFGFSFNLIDHDILDPTLAEDKLRLRASCQYSRSEMDWNSRNVDWSEWYADTTLSIVNDVDGNKFFLPYSISLYIGPFFSHIESDTLDEKENVGVTGGLEIFYTDSVSLTLGVEVLDGVTGVGGVHVQF